ncbi:hypothetical protein [Azospirillum argentinense]
MGSLLVWAVVPAAAETIEKNLFGDGYIVRDDAGRKVQSIEKKTFGEGYTVRDNRNR